MDGSIWLQLEAILNKHECHLHQKNIQEVFILWGTLPRYDTLEPKNILHQFYHL